MNWLFEAYSNVYNTAMGQRPFHHMPRFPSEEQRQQPRRAKRKRDV